MSPLDRHEKIALQLSGGKDSLATLYLLRDFWEKITVYWLNTGAAPPTSVERMHKIRALVPHFVEIISDQPKDIEANGYPVDILPLRTHNGSRMFEPHEGIKLQPWMACCANNLFFPLHNRMIKDKITLIIRGQRNEEQRKALIRSGESMDGFEVYFPLENWTEKQVFDYLRDNDIEIPPNYAYDTSSVDCWSCTAFGYANKGRAAFFRDHEPALYPKFIGILKEIRGEVSRELGFIDAMIDA